MRVGVLPGVCTVLFGGIHRTISDLLYQRAKKCGVQTCLHGQWREGDKFFSKGMNVKELVFYRQTESERQLYWQRRAGSQGADFCNTVRLKSHALSAEEFEEEG